jgi:hypothetical protein
MMKYTLSLMLAALSLTGCSTLDRTATKLDMMAGRVTSSDNVEFEGRVIAARRVGAMMAIEFEGGKMYDVEDTPFKFEPGDTLRIYKTHKGFEARLWREAADPKLKTTGLKAPKRS